jgi:anaerobic magnesium-protoporphyrin IX monomethyl ester cyclase
MHIALYFPPHWTPAMPHLALPRLTAALRRDGFSLSQRDLNIEAMVRLLSRPGLQAALTQARRRHRQLEQRRPSTSKGEAWETREREHLNAVLTAADELVEDIELAKEILRSSAFFEPNENLGAMLTVLDALDLASAPYFPASVSWLGHDVPYAIDSVPGLVQAVRDPDHNIFLHMFQSLVLPQLEREAPELVGISLSSVHQVVPGLTLAAMIKAVRPQTHVTVGGKMITCWRDALPHHPELFSLFDSAVYFEGERAIVELARSLSAGSDLAKVPNLLYREDGVVKVNQPTWTDDLDVLPPADYDGLPLDAYLTPERILPIEAGRGCYWGRCAFCNLGYGQSRRHVARRGEAVAEEMSSLATRHGARHFFFVDEALSPRLLRSLSAALRERDADVHWTACVRFEEALDAALLADLYAAGCRMLMFGLEAGSQTLLDRIGKGTRLETVSRILRQSADAGIWNHVFVFFGFPGETEVQAAETIDFMTGHLPYVHSVAAGTFVLEKGSAVFERPEVFGVDNILINPEDDLAFRYDYTLQKPEDAADPQQSLECLANTLNRRRAPKVFFDDPYNLLYASRFRDRTVLWTESDGMAAGDVP